MKYTKPELLLLGQAVEAVQGVGKPGGSLDASIEHSAGAYEADE